MRICLVRHGETDWNLQNKLQGTSDIPLNETGKMQAQKSSAVLGDIHWDVIISSPLIRAKETAEIINQKLSLPVEEMDEFKERNYGKAEGLSLKEYNKMLPNIPGLESHESVTKRVSHGIKMIQKKYPDKNILIVAHGAVINSILAKVSGGKIGTRKTRLENACISNIRFQNDSWSIIDYNQSAHLLS
ncbi:MAG: yhfR [Bacillales bacterium]|nr:yhfR [Bacillales bacterium]